MCSTNLCVLLLSLCCVYTRGRCGRWTRGKGRCGQQTAYRLPTSKTRREGSGSKQQQQLKAGRGNQLQRTGVGPDVAARKAAGQGVLANGAAATRSTALSRVDYRHWNGRVPLASCLLSLQPKPPSVSPVSCSAQRINGCRSSCLAAQSQ